MLKKPNSPFVSVIISVYNSETYLNESMRSMLDQTYHNFELIIINDGSTDNSKEVINSYLKKDRRIVYLENKKNVGLPISLNKGIKSARGIYIARMDADDISFPERLAKQVDFLRKNGDIYVLGTASLSIDGKGAILGLSEFPTDPEFIRKNLIKENLFYHPSVMIRKKYFEKVGLYDERMTYAQDYELWLRGANLFNYTNLKEPLVKHRESSNYEIKVLKKRKKVTYYACKARLRSIFSGNYSFIYVYCILFELFKLLIPCYIKYLYYKVIGRNNLFVKMEKYNES